MARHETGLVRQTLQQPFHQTPVMSLTDMQTDTQLILEQGSPGFNPTRTSK